jgi:Ca-activated chloride channel homolog
MFEFANPLYLLLALLVPPLIWWWLRQPRPAVRHPAAGLLASLPHGRARLARWGGAGLRALALLALVASLAGPRRPDRRTRIETEGIALVIAVDVSNSMARPDFDWNGEPVSRLEAVQRVFRLFVSGDSGGVPLPPGARLEGRPTDLIGLVTFAARPETIRPLTLSHSGLLDELDAEKPRHVPGESETNLSDPLAIALHHLQSAGPRRKVLVLLTDGEHNVTNPRSTWTPRQAAQLAASLHVPVYAIDAGSGPTLEGPAPEGLEPSNPLVVRSHAVQTLKELAHLTGGRYFPAADTAGLLDACRAIDRLERTDIPSFHYRRYHEAYPWFALSSFALFTLALALDLTLWRRLP